MFGLICVDFFESWLQLKFPLKSVNVECEVRNLLVTCTSEFVYKNDSDKNSEALFSFPLEGSCVVYHFEAMVGGKVIMGICKELEEAKNMYKAATEAGQKAAMIERNPNMTDVFKCRIGNIPKQSEAKIILKFAMELKLILSKSEDKNIDRFSLCLPLILRPRYTPANFSDDSKVYQVNNNYEYNFKANVSGTIEIVNIFSNNYKLIFTLDSAKRTSGQIILESKFDGTQDLDLEIDYLKMKVPSVLYEYGTSSSKFTGNRSNGAFYKTDVAMLNFLPQFESEEKRQNKMEIIIVVDRSGSMSGTNIQHAKECVLIFLKSLPTNCKFQIYGFGSTFNKAFPSPRLYDEQWLEIALNYQRNIKADLGGTELMMPLQDLYRVTLTSDYTRIVFLLTDGDVGNQNEVFKLVRQHSQLTRLFTVGIGHGVSTSLVQKIAESGYGKAVFVRDSKTLSSSVIELLDIALNCDIFTDCKIEWKCPKNASVIMVPSNPGPLFSNYFLTVFCMINDLEDDDSIECLLSGNANGKPLRLSLTFNGKEGTSDDDFRVHRMLAKYKIDEMTTQIEDGQNDLKKSLIELSREVNMVTNYTTFLAIDQDAPEKGLIAQETPDLEMYDNSMAFNQCFSRSFAAPGCMMQLSQPVSGLRLHGGGGGGGGVLFGASAPCQSNLINTVPPPPPPILLKRNMDTAFGCLNNTGAPPAPPPPPPSSSMLHQNVLFEHQPSKIFEAIEDIVIFLVDKQNYKGSWNINDEVLKKLKIDILKVKESKPALVSDEVWMTVIVYQYFVVKLTARENEWKLFIKKSKQWLMDNLNDLANFNDLMELGSKML